jgi:hypothetical protein
MDGMASAKLDPILYFLVVDKNLPLDRTVVVSITLFLEIAVTNNIQPTNRRSIFVFVQT